MIRFLNFKKGTPIMAADFVFGGYLFRKHGEGYHLVSYYPKDWSEVPPDKSRFFRNRDEAYEWVNGARQRSGVPPIDPTNPEDPGNSVTKEGYEAIMSSRRAAAERRRKK